MIHCKYKSMVNLFRTLNINMIKSIIFLHFLDAEIYDN